jgi:hypothetical protein
MGGLDAIIAAFDATIEQIDTRIDATLERLALKIIQDAKRLAPIDTGDLEAALIVGEVKQLIGASYIDFGTSPEVNNYAVVQHEGFMHREGKLVPLTPGEKTLSKGPYNGEMPGKKYLERAIKMNEKLIIEELSKILEG